MISLWFYTVWMSLTGRDIEQLQRAENEYLKAENVILRNRCGSKVKTTSAERERLLQYGRPLGSASKELITIVTPQTFMKWVRDAERAESNLSKQGRPRVS